MTRFADLADRNEDERIETMGELAAGGGLIAFVVEDDAKADRYVAKLLARHRVRLIGRGPGPVAGTVEVRIGPILQ